MLYSTHRIEFRQTKEKGLEMPGEESGGPHEEFHRHNLPCADLRGAEIKALQRLLSGVAAFTVAISNRVNLDYPERECRHAIKLLAQYIEDPVFLLPRVPEVFVNQSTYAEASVEFQKMLNSQPTSYECGVGDYLKIIQVFCDYLREKRASLVESYIKDYGSSPN